MILIDFCTGDFPSSLDALRIPPLLSVNYAHGIETDGVPHQGITMRTLDERRSIIASRCTSVHDKTLRTFASLSSRYSIHLHR